MTDIPKDIPKVVYERFSELSSSLSPENLHCDGEISNAEANRKYNRLMKEWHKLEDQVGREVTESEIWEWEDSTCSL